MPNMGALQELFRPFAVLPCTHPVCACVCMCVCEREFLNLLFRPFAVLPPGEREKSGVERREREKTPWPSCRAPLI